MQQIPLNGLTLYFQDEDHDSVDLIQQACEKSIRLIGEHLGLEAPEDCRVYIMNSWIDFMSHSAPWPWKILVILTMPIWVFRIRKIWPIAGGWELGYGRRRRVGVKPSRLMQEADTRIGERLFTKGKSPSEKVQFTTCHELTHAFTSHLRLPTWLNEGLAMVMVDKYFEEQTVQHETLAMLERYSAEFTPGGRQRLRVGDEDGLVYLYARGYWLTRYIDETRPGLLKTSMARRLQHKELENKIAKEYGKRLRDFWREIDSELVAYFK